MAEIIGVGCTHYPPLITPDEDRGFPINVTLNRDERLPEELKNPLNWPEPMQKEYGDDQGMASAAVHRARLVEGFRRVRREILDFNPDFVIVFGGRPVRELPGGHNPALLHPGLRGLPVCAFHAPRHAPPQRVGGTCRQGVQLPGPPRGSPVPGQRAAGLRRGHGLCLSSPLHEPGLAHAFINTLLYLDYDREGFDFPVIPFAVNCYGRAVISNRGGILPHKVDGQTLEPDPPGPAPKRCMEVGATVARVLRD